MVSEINMFSDIVTIGKDAEENYGRNGLRVGPRLS